MLNLAELASPLWLVVAACLAVSAFMSFAETCLTSLSESKVHALVAERGRAARVLLLWLREPHAVLATILVVNTLANILATAVLTQVVLAAHGERAVTWAVGLMTFAVLMFGEITPKTLARRHAVRAAVPTMLALRVVHVALLPVTIGLTHLARVTVRLLGRRLNPGRDVSEAEIEALVDLGRREGSLVPAKADMLRAVFRLGELSAREVMVARTEVAAIDLRLSPAEIVAAAREAGHSRLPAHEGRIDDIVGILHATDLFHAAASAGGVLEVRSLLREPLFVGESARLDVLLRQFRRSRQHLAVVLDEFGGTAGVVSLEDVLEQLVGEIWDEHDVVEPWLVRGGGGSWTVDGGLPLAALDERLGIEVGREANYETVAGLVLDLVGRVPRAGDSVAWRGHRVEVLAADERRVTQVRITRMDGTEPPGADLRPGGSSAGASPPRGSTPRGRAREP